MDPLSTKGGPLETSACPKGLGGADQMVRGLCFDGAEQIMLILADVHALYPSIPLARTATPAFLSSSPMDAYLPRMGAS